MPIVAVLNTKGGAGKTTLTTNLSHALKMSSGHAVRVIDSDPQGSATDWHEAGGKELLPVVKMTRASLDRDIKDIQKPDEWILIDGAPRADELAAAAIRAADFVLIPVQPSPYDIWASEPLVKAIKFRQNQNNGFPKAAFVISRAIVGTALARLVEKTLAKYELPVFENKTHQRIIYAETASTGQTVSEDPNNKAAWEINGIRKELERFVQAALDEAEQVRQEEQSERATNENEKTVQHEQSGSTG